MLIYTYKRRYMNLSTEYCYVNHIKNISICILDYIDGYSHGTVICFIDTQVLA